MTFLGNPGLGRPAIRSMDGYLAILHFLRGNHHAQILFLPQRLMQEPHYKSNYVAKSYLLFFM